MGTSPTRGRVKNWAKDIAQLILKGQYATERYHTNI